MELSGGVHDILVGIQPLEGQQAVRWMIGVGDLLTKQWLTGIWR